MANQVAARLAGDDYQHLYAWWHVLGLRIPHLQLDSVCVEDEQAGSFDDVTLHYARATGRASHFFQVKYHVDLRSAYSTAALIERTSGSSLLQKFWRTWHKVRTTGTEPRLTLFSNWNWDAADEICRCIDGNDGSLTPEFLTHSARTAVGKLRDQWLAECGGSLDEFAEFARSLRLQLGSTNVADEVAQRTAERMFHLGLRHDETALKLACATVRHWIKRGVQRLTREGLDATIAELGLREVPSEPTATVYLETIKKRRFDLTPDYLLDWRDHFSGSQYERGHTTLDASLWNEQMLPELQALEERVNQERGARLIRARGLSRLSAWFAFGKVFSRVAGYEIEVQQGAALWRTDAAPAPDFTLVATRTPTPRGTCTTLAVGLSITGLLSTDVERYLDATAFAGGVLLLEPSRGPARDVFRDAADVAAFAKAAKQMIREWVDRTGATEVLLFYFGPLSGACFLGHDLNALGARITVMEDQSPGYAPAFLFD